LRGNTNQRTVTSVAWKRKVDVRKELLLNRSLVKIKENGGPGGAEGGGALGKRGARKLNWEAEKVPKFKQKR